MSSVDSHGNIHSDTTGQFAGHVHTEADPGILAAPDQPTDGIPERGTPEHTAHARAFSDRLATLLGADVLGTGGGCTAVELALPNGAALSITNGDSAMPDGGYTLLGFYDPDGVWDEDAQQELMDGPYTPEQLADHTRRLAHDYLASQWCDPDRLRADLEAADPDGRYLTAAQRDVMVDLGTVLDGQPQVSVDASCGSWSCTSLGLPDADEQTRPGKVTKVVADFATADAPGPREVSYRSEWTVAGTDWSNGTEMVCWPGDEQRPDHVRATVARIGQIQARCDEQINRRGLQNNSHDWGKFASMMVRHDRGRTVLRVSPGRGRDAQLIVDGDHFTEALVDTEFGVWRADGDDLRVVLGRLAQSVWFQDTKAGEASSAPMTPEELQHRLLGND